LEEELEKRIIWVQGSLPETYKGKVRENEPVPELHNLHK
jgi:hypothetical protein